MRNQQIPKMRNSSQWGMYHTRQRKVFAPKCFKFNYYILLQYLGISRRNTTKQNGCNMENKNAKSRPHVSKCSKYHVKGDKSKMLELITCKMQMPCTMEDATSKTASYVGSP